MINWVVIGVLLIAVTYTIMTAKGGVQDHVVRIGQAAPEIEGVDINGREVKLSDYRGKGVVLHYWGSWCPSCVKEMPFIKQAYESAMAGVEVLGVNMGDSKGTAHEFVTSHQLSFPVLMDPSGSAAEAYRIKGLPATVFITAQGKVEQLYAGEFTSLDQITSIMKRIQPKKPDTQ
ncbi:redoxin domain-containing protein [Paenibacillus sp. N1-5-1-14]|uniref:redoxin domain-containing protein n=1 Tax=Paenibacillus radicibacter TaxID=2972488 RepID=UPI0021596A3F|nr:redoxin domain-containing protein [Paenibacillus radicibacter]MCR8645475.1 redoxin domain-containing protein [Paenibacillus radicibacter]